MKVFESEGWTALTPRIEHKGVESIHQVVKSPDDPRYEAGHADTDYGYVASVKYVRKWNDKDKDLQGETSLTVKHSFKTWEEANAWTVEMYKHKRLEDILGSDGEFQFFTDGTKFKDSPGETVEVGPGVWETHRHYRIAEQVLIPMSDLKFSYWRCRKAHQATSLNRPNPAGPDETEYWKRYWLNDESKSEKETVIAFPDHIQIDGLGTPVNQQVSLSFTDENGVAKIMYYRVMSSSGRLQAVKPAV